MLISIYFKVHKLHKNRYALIAISEKHSVKFIPFQVML